MARAAIPPLYREAVWDDVLVPDALAFRDSLESGIRRGRGLILAGPVGTGKTHLAALYGKHALSLGFSVRWENAALMMDEMQDTRRRLDVEARQMHVDLLIWDEFLLENLYDWQIALFSRIVEMRHNRKRSMIVTTNISTELMQKDDKLARIVDRWVQTCRIIDIAGDSRRKPA
jgi:DNA replication protein DnaC